MPELERTPLEKELNGQDMNFDRYRSLVDDRTDGSRKIGLLDKDKYSMSLRDPRSIIVTTEDDIDIPVFVPIQYAEGYDAHRTRKFVSRVDANKDEDIYYFCLPPGVIDSSQVLDLGRKLQEVLLQDTFIFFDYNSKDVLAKSQLEEILSQLDNVEISSIPLFEPSLEDKDKQASLGLFVASTYTINAEDEPSKTNNSISEEFDLAVSRGEYEKYPRNGPTILKGTEIMSGLRDQMWQIYIDRFRGLGQFHPITMEDTRGGFENMLDNPKTTCSINFKDGLPVCWMVFLQDVDDFEWLNSSYFTPENLKMSQDEEILFFPEIAAKADDIGNYSEATLALAAKMVARTDRKYKVVFESTNLSRQYIPKLVEEYVKNTRVLTVEKPIEVDRQLYACYRLKQV